MSSSNPNPPPPPVSASSLTSTAAATPLRRRSSLGSSTSSSRPRAPPLGAPGSSTSTSSSSSLLGQSSTSGAPISATIQSLIVKSTTHSSHHPLAPATPSTAAHPLTSPPTHVVPAAHAPSPLTLPDNFAQVEPGIYRSALPSAASLAFLRTLALRTVVLLTPDLPSRAVVAWLDEAGVQVVHLGAARAWGSLAGAAKHDGSGTPPGHTGLLPFPPSSAPLPPSAAAATNASAPALPSTASPGPPTWRPVSEDLVKDALQHLLNPASHPVLVACTTGIHETGTVIGCLRRMQRWNFNAIAFEYRQFADTKARYAAEQMVELFDVDWVVVPRGAGARVCGLVEGAGEAEEVEVEVEAQARE